MREPFTTIKKGKYKIVQRKNLYGQDIYVLLKKIWWIFYGELKRAGNPIILKKHMDNYIKIELNNLTTIKKGKYKIIQT